MAYTALYRSNFSVPICTTAISVYRSVPHGNSRVPLCTIPQFPCTDPYHTAFQWDQSVPLCVSLCTGSILYGPHGLAVILREARINTQDGLYNVFREWSVNIMFDRSSHL